MLRKRIIFTLIYADGFFMQSRNFRLQKVGDINWLKKNYQFQKISFSLDELIILNASRNEKDMQHFSNVVMEISQDVFIPVSAGGGIRSMEDAERLFNYGADKIVLNSVLHGNPDFVKELVNRYGTQSILASIDYKVGNDGQEIYILDGTEKLNFSLNQYLQYVETLLVGEIYLNSIDKDGTGFGYDIKTVSSIQNEINVPLIIAGGAGNEKHFLEGLKMENVSAVATANLFNFIGNGLPSARRKIIDNKINIARWQNSDSN